MKALISIIIPCFNSGKYLAEAIESVERYSGPYSFEIIIIDDGSTEEETKVILKNLSNNNYRVLYQKNKGPASARNTGCKHAQGKYFLFLDSDNKIEPEYIEIGIDNLNANLKIGVVHGNAKFFGETSRPNFDSGPFNIKKMLAENYLDTCAVVRKEAWESVGGFDESLEVFVHEDWDFWLSIYKTGWEFLYVDKPLFHYRVRNDSLMSNTIRKSDKSSNVYIFRKHADIVSIYYLPLFINSLIYMQDIERPFRSFFKFLSIKYLKK